MLKGKASRTDALIAKSSQQRLMEGLKAIFHLAHTEGRRKIKDMNWKDWLKRQQALPAMRLTD
jgi:hypothetical protein